MFTNPTDLGDVPEVEDVVYLGWCRKHIGNDRLIHLDTGGCHQFACA